jgi:hypothetical protein
VNHEKVSRDSNGRARASCLCGSHCLPSSVGAWGDRQLFAAVPCTSHKVGFELRQRAAPAGLPRVRKRLSRAMRPPHMSRRGCVAGHREAQRVETWKTSRPPCQPNARSPCSIPGSQPNPFRPGTDRSAINRLSRLRAHPVRMPRPAEIGKPLGLRVDMDWAQSDPPYHLEALFSRL